MDKRKILLIIIILLIILLICIIGILLLTNKQQEKNSVPYEEEGRINIKTESKIREVTNRNNFYAVKNCIDKFYTYYASIYDVEGNYYIIDEEVQKTIETEKKEKSKAIYFMLDEEYINARGINENNILTKIKSINSSKINIRKMYVSEKSISTAIYFVYGRIRDEKTSEISDFSIIVKLDSANRTFSVMLQDYVSEKYSDIQLGSNIDIQMNEKIEKNEYNIYGYKNISDEDYAVNLFNKYKDEVIYSPQLAYATLNEEYRNKRFGTLDDFQEYAKNNVRKHTIMKISQYKKTQTDDYTQYVCIDQNGNEYIFRETSVMNYTLILDTYTIDLPEFLEKYETATENEKVLMNIQKVFNAINAGDYRYVYNKLDETFKSTYFKKELEFENYIKQKIYTNNTVKYGDYQKSGDVYIYNLQINDKENATSRTVNFKTVMQLKEGTNFVMSFNVE